MWGSKIKYFIFFLMPFAIIGLFANEKDQANELEKVVQRLGAESFKAREQASKDLIEIVQKDETLIEKLKKFSNHKDPEVRIRIKEVLKDFAQILKWMDPANEKILKSQRNGKAVKLTFLNKSKQTIKIYWINWSGQRSSWRGEIKPGGSEVCDRSYGGHVWLVTDKNDKGLGIYILNDEDGQIIFRGSPKK